MTLRNVDVARPSYDLIGAPPALLQELFTVTPGRKFQPGKIRLAALAVPSAEKIGESGGVQADSITLRVESLRSSGGTAILIDKPDHTTFALKITDLRLTVDGPADLFGPKSNTVAEFVMNGKKQMRWTAVTDFSTWPPRFRLTDVR